MLQLQGSTKPLVSKQVVSAPNIKSRVSVKKMTPKSTAFLPPIQKTGHPAKKNGSQSMQKDTIRRRKVDKKLSAFEEAEVLLTQPASDTPGSCGRASIRFNHYNKSFPVHNGVLKWQDVDDEYCISFVYRGNYNRDIILEDIYDPQNPEANRTRRDDGGVYFLGVLADSSYRLILQEDPSAGIGAEGMRLQEGPLRAAQSPAKCTLKSGNAAVEDITHRLRGMAACDLQTEEARQLRELRDLEDILYS